MRHDIALPRTTTKSAKQDSQPKRKTTRGYGQFQCPHCPQIFSYSSNLNRHLPIHTGQFKYWCNKCQKGFTQKETYESHVRKHEGRVLMCSYEFCKKTFESSRGLELHISKHTGKYPFYCVNCNKGFHSKFHLERHQKCCR